MVTISSSLKPESGKSKSAIIITTYNHAHFLNEALDSCMRQTTTVDDIIVVDDGSTDDPVSVVDRYHGVQFIRQENRGLAAARNTGLAATNAEFICFLDADDRLLPEAMEVGIRHLEHQTQTAMAYGAYRTIDNAGRPTSAKIQNPTSRDAYLQFVRRGNFIGMHATVVYRRQCLIDAGGFDEKFRACEDYELFLRITKSAKISSHNELVAEYRRHSQNMSLDYPMMLSAALRALDAQNETRPEVQMSIAEGKRFWKNYYAAELAKDGLGRMFVRPSMAMRLIGQSINMAPFAFVKLIAAKLLRRTVKLTASIVGRRVGDGNWAPRPGAVKFGDFGRTRPISGTFGFDRGDPIDRYYIEKFLHRHSSDIHGRVLEIGDNTYTMQFGGDNVVKSDVLHVDAVNSNATIIGDLSAADVLPANAFDCIILTQTLHLIFDMPKAISSLAAALKPGGVLLLTVPGITPIDRGEWRHTWYWSLTDTALTRLLSGSFEPSDISVHSFGNVFAAVCFLQGLAQAEVPAQKLDVCDAAFPVVVAARIYKRA